MHQINDGRFPDNSPVEVRCGPDEWYVCVEVRELAVLRDGRRPPRRRASRNLYYPCCYRDSSEIWPRPADEAIPDADGGAGR